MNTIDIILASKARESRQSREHECVWREDAPVNGNQSLTEREPAFDTRQKPREDDDFAAHLLAHTQVTGPDQAEEAALDGLPAPQLDTDTAETPPERDEPHIDWEAVAFFAYTGHLPTDAGNSESTAEAPPETPIPPTTPSLLESLVMQEQGQPGLTDQTDQTDRTDQTDLADLANTADTTPIDPVGIATDATPAPMPPAPMPPAQMATIRGENEPKAEAPPPTATPVATNAPDIQAELPAALPTDMQNNRQSDEQGNSQQSPAKHAALSPQPGIPENVETSALNAPDITLQTESTIRVSPPPPPTTQTSADQTMDITRFIEQFDHLTLRTMRSDDQRLRIELEPAALGKLVLQCKETASGLAVELSVQGEAVRSLLMGQEADLRASLASQGVQVGQFSVSCQDREGRPTTDQQNADTPNTFERLHVQPPQLVSTPAPARRLAAWERNRWVA